MESTKRLDALGSSPFPLTAVFFGLLAAHRGACRQERTFQWLSGFAVGWLVTLGRHTVTRVLAALGLVEVDWSAFYRLFGRERLAYDALCRTLLRQTLALAPADAPYLVAVDGTTIPRRSKTMPGTGWLRAAGLAALCWVRRELDALGRAAQRLVVVADGTDATVELWKRLPAGVVLLVRCAKNRALFELPPPPPPPPASGAGPGSTATKPAILAGGWPSAAGGTGPSSRCGAGSCAPATGWRDRTGSRGRPRAPSSSWSSRASTGAAGGCGASRPGGW